MFKSRPAKLSAASSVSAPFGCGRPGRAGSPMSSPAARASGAPGEVWVSGCLWPRPARARGRPRTVHSPPRSRIERPFVADQLVRGIEVWMIGGDTHPGTDAECIDLRSIPHELVDRKLV